MLPLTGLPGGGAEGEMHRVCTVDGVAEDAMTLMTKRRGKSVESSTG